MNDELFREATQRALSIAREMFPATFKPDTPYLLQVAVGLLYGAVALTGRVNRQRRGAATTDIRVGPTRPRRRCVGDV